MSSFQPFRRHFTESARSAREVERLGNFLFDRDSQVEANVRQLLTARSNEGLIRSLTRSDLIIAAINGLAHEHPYLAPQPPERVDEIDLSTTAPFERDYLNGLPGETLVVRYASNPVLHQTFFALAASGGAVNGDGSVRGASGILRVGDSFYQNYLTRQQKVTKILAHDAERFLDCASRLVALEIAENLSGRKESILGYAKPGLSVHSVVPDGIQLNLGGARILFQPLPEDSTVFMPCCGLSVVRDLPQLSRARGVRFILNDRDPFVSRVLESALSLVSIPGVRCISGLMSNAIAESTEISAVVLSDPGGIPESEIMRFSSGLKRALRPDGRIHLFWRESGQAGSHISDWEGALGRHGLQSAERIGLEIRDGVSRDDCSRSSFVQMSGLELATYLQNQPLELSTSRGAYLIARHF